jgi:hypothetical protein
MGYSVQEGSHVDTGFPRPLSRGLRPTESRDDVIGSRIEHLFGSRCPSAVIRKIAFRAVNPIQLMVVRRRRPHIGIELLEALPFRANRDATLGVVLALQFVPWALAAGSHSAPDSMFSGLVHAVPAPHAEGALFTAKTATGLNVTVQNEVEHEVLFDAAVTPEAPITPFVPPFVQRGHTGNCCQPTKDLARIIDV